MWYKINKPQKVMLLLGFFVSGVGFFFLGGIHSQMGWYWCFVAGSIFVAGLTSGTMVASTIEVFLGGINGES